jgi:hypothetical protein
LVSDLVYQGGTKKPGAALSVVQQFKIFLKLIKKIIFRKILKNKVLDAVSVG